MSTLFIPISAFAVFALVALLLLFFGLVLWRRGYHAQNGDDEGTGVAHISAMIGFCVGLLVLLPGWRRLSQEPALLGLLLLFIAIGAFQVGLAAQGLSNRYVRAEGEESRGIAASSLYTLLLMPSGEVVSRDEQPWRFWLWTVGRAVMGISLILFQPLILAIGPIQRSATH
jgi:hypothetical protein